MVSLAQCRLVGLFRHDTLFLVIKCSDASEHVHVLHTIVPEIALRSTPTSDLSCTCGKVELYISTLPQKKTLSVS